MEAVNPTPANATPLGRSALSLLGWFLVTFAAAALGSLTGPGDWYRSLNKPSWNPPNWLFGPVWSLLYACMAIAAWRVWRHGGWSAHRIPLNWFLIQLGLNAAWSWLFFGLHRPDLALVEIVLLAAAIAVTLREFWKVDRFAGGLLVPYLAWVSFATFLNFTLWQMNR